MSRRPNGEGTVFRLKNGRWRAEITVAVTPDGRPVKKSRTGRTKTEAFRLLEELKAQYATGDANEFPVDMTMQAWCEHWLEHSAAQSVIPDTLTQYHWLLRHYVFPQIGRIELKRLRPPALDQWQSALVARGLAQGTVKAARAPLSAALNQAFRLGLIQSNPLQPIKTPKKAHEAGRRRWLEPEDHEAYIKLFTDHDDRRLSAYVLVMLHRGLRKEEVTGLRWEAIDIEARQLDVKTRVRRERRRGPDGVYVTSLEEGRLKSATSYRQVTLNGPLISALMEWKKEQTRIRWQTGGWPDDWVFTTKTGRPVDSRNMERAYKKAIDNAGLPYVSFHDLRRTIGRLAHDNGADMSTVKVLMGHSSTTITEQAYVGHIARDASIAASALDQTLDPDHPPYRLEAVAGAPHDQDRPNPTKPDNPARNSPTRPPQWGIPTASLNPGRSRKNNSHQLDQPPRSVHSGVEPPEE